jgi:multidrug resistance protein, MATE family
MTTPPSQLKRLLTLAWPVILARATQSIVGFSDALMVTPLGEAELAAVTTGALNVLTFVLLPMGVCFILQSFSAQLRGRGDLATARNYARYGLVLAAVSVIPTALCIPLLEPVLHLLGYAPDVEHHMRNYMAIRLLSVGGIVGIEALNNWYGGLGNTQIALFTGAAVMVLNIFLNYVLIEPRFGLPGYGVEGAAWASTSATVLGFLGILLAYRLGIGHSAPAQRFSFRLSEFRRVLRFGLPAGLNYFLEFSSFALFINVVVGHLGTTVLAAFNVVFQWSSVAFMPAFGMATGGAIMVGETIGKGEPSEVPPLTWLTLKLSAGWMLGVGLMYIAFPRLFFSLFSSQGENSAALLEVGALMLAISGAWQVFDAIAIVLSESLRAAGDTTWPMMARIVLAWFVFTPAAWTMVLVFDGGPGAVMFSIVGYTALVALALFFRFRSGAWRKIALLGPSEPNLVEPAEGDAPSA